jgi:ubiquinone biosynthesis protein
VLAELARVAETRTAWGADYHVTDLAGEFTDRLREELDFRLEARNATEIAAAMAATDQIHVPAVHSELSTARVLVMEWLDGVSVREVERIDALGLDRARLAEALLRCALRQMLVDGRFHADPHPGNVLVLADGRLGLIDFGAAGRLDPSSRRRCGRCWSRCSSATPGCCGRPCWRWPPCAATSTTTS